NLTDSMGQSSPSGTTRPEGSTQDARPTSTTCLLALWEGTQGALKEVDTSRNDTTRRTKLRTGSLICLVICPTLYSRFILYRTGYKPSLCRNRSIDLYQVKKEPNCLFLPTKLQTPNVANYHITI